MQMELIIKYESVCNEIINAFCEKQKLDFDWWVNDTIGIACFSGQYSINLYDIVFDLKTNQKKGLITDWYCYLADELTFKKRPYVINYQSYAKGARYEK